MNLQEVGECCGNWMQLAQDRDRWRTLVNTVMFGGNMSLWTMQWCGSFMCPVHSGVYAVCSTG